MQQLTHVLKSQRKYMSPENNNEILEIKANRVIKKILSFINKSPYFTLLVDETILMFQTKNS